MSYSCSKKVILIGGVPGSGKTTIARELSKKLNALYINVSEYALSKKLIIEYDEERETYIIDEDAVVNDILNYICSTKHEIVIVDTHYGEIFPEEAVSMYFILRINPNTLYQRLKSRGWNERKIKENVLAEVLGVNTANALSNFKREKICEIDATSKSVSELVNEISEIIFGKKKCSRKLIDWTLILDFNEIKNYLI